MESNKDPYAHFYDRLFLPNYDSTRSKRKRGRPKGSLNEKTIWKKLLAIKHTSKETGESRTILEWVILTLKKLVAEGDFNAITVYEHFFGPIYDPTDSTEGLGGILLAPADMEPEEWIAKMEEKNHRLDRIRKEVMQEMGID